ncbi:MAG: hypothetical protein WCP39_00610 [Chlamydiota bacterium]
MTILGHVDAGSRVAIEQLPNNLKTVVDGFIVNMPKLGPRDKAFGFSEVIQQLVGRQFTAAARELFHLSDRCHAWNPSGVIGHDMEMIQVYRERLQPLGF